jgi:Straboviridae dCMP hydroxymethylase
MSIHREYVEDVRGYFIDALKKEEFVVDKTGCRMLELVNASFIADEDHIFLTPNKEYIARELEWYKSQSLYVADIPGGPPKIWQQVASRGGKVNSNYGWCVFSQDNHLQYDHALAELIANPFSRRAVMIYNRPTMWWDYNDNGMSDFMCTFATQHVIRNEVLDSMVFMRSNDVTFGYRNDYAWQKYVHDSLADELGVDRGRIYWNAGSLHVYERDFKHVC